MKPKYSKMPPQLKTEEERLHYRILELEAENIILKKLQTLNQTEIRILSKRFTSTFITITMSVFK